MGKRKNKDVLHYRNNDHDFQDGLKTLPGNLKTIYPDLAFAVKRHGVFRHSYWLEVNGTKDKITAFDSRDGIDINQLESNGILIRIHKRDKQTSKAFKINNNKLKFDSFLNLTNLKVAEVEGAKAADAQGPNAPGGKDKGKQKLQAGEELSSSQDGIRIGRKNLDIIEKLQELDGNINQRASGGKVFRLIQEAGKCNATSTAPILSQEERARAGKLGEYLKNHRLINTYELVPSQNSNMVSLKLIGIDQKALLAFEFTTETPTLRIRDPRKLPGEASTSSGMGSVARRQHQHHVGNGQLPPTPPRQGYHNPQNPVVVMDNSNFVQEARRRVTNAEGIVAVTDQTLRPVPPRPASRPASGQHSPVIQPREHQQPSQQGNAGATPPKPLSAARSEGDAMPIMVPPRPKVPNRPAPRKPQQPVTHFEADARVPAQPQTLTPPNRPAPRVAPQQGGSNSAPHPQRPAQPAPSPAASAEQPVRGALPQPRNQAASVPGSRPVVQRPVPQNNPRGQLPPVPHTAVSTNVPPARPLLRQAPAPVASHTTPVGQPVRGALPQPRNQAASAPENIQVRTPPVFRPYVPQSNALNLFPPVPHTVVSTNTPPARPLRPAHATPAGSPPALPPKTARSHGGSQRVVNNQRYNFDATVGALANELGLPDVDVRKQLLQAVAPNRDWNAQGRNVQRMIGRQETVERQHIEAVVHGCTTNQTVASEQVERVVSALQQTRQHGVG